MKILKIASAEYRVWRANISKLVAEDGTAVRDVTQEEANILRDLDKRATASRNAEAYVEDGPPEKKIEVTPTVNPTNGIVSLSRTIDGLKLMSGREVMRAELFAKHGSFQLRTQNGKFAITSMRAPSTSTASSVAGVPPPDNCPTCQNYAGRMPGRHHWICQWNDKADPDQRGSKDGVVVQSAAPAPGVPALAVAPKGRFVSSTAPVAKPVPGAPQAQVTPGFLMPPTSKPVIETTAAATPFAAPVAVAAPPVIAAPAAPPAPAGPPSPEACPNGCTAWANYAKDGEHHAICQWRQSWIDSKIGTEPKYLVDLETEQVLREATPEEIKEADEHLGIVSVADKSYGVVARSEIAAVAGAAE